MFLVFSKQLSSAEGMILCFNSLNVEHFSEWGIWKYALWDDFEQHRLDLGGAVYIWVFSVNTAQYREYIFFFF